MSLTFAALHGGKSPTTRRDLRYLVRSSCRAIGEIKAISYASDKGTGPETHRHPFDEWWEADGVRRSPYLLRADPKGTFEAGDPVSDTVIVGMLVDLELDNGRVVVLPSPVWIATDKKGERLLLCAARGVPYAIEVRMGTFHVDTHGING